MNVDALEKDRQRAECYRLLAACYCLPGKEFIEEGLVENLTKALEPLCPGAVPHTKEMADALAHCNMRTEILVDYSALFVGPFELLAPPYGSVYMEKEGRVLGDSTVDAVQTYRSAGVEMDTDQKDIPDHISVELEFMYYLLTRETESLENGDTEKAFLFRKIREDFLERHLGAWVFDFTGRMREKARTSFYGGLADCTTAFMLAEMNGERVGNSAGMIVQ